ncbi:hypothetical protein P5673_012222 [Acropora cervicornis]|uniref:Uncharacterized protein n=1 Tax=Acropora cervicornis TaxID=6130 RepID=A0AAD9QMG2_ACRCE|nr:hypothetical protein P5673_012222 [Acropora cervicornis]
MEQCDGVEGLCIMLKRFAYPCRYSDLIPIFERSVPELSMISNEVVDWRRKDARCTNVGSSDLYDDLKNFAFCPEECVCMVT